MNLFMDTSNNTLILILEQENKIVDSLYLQNQNKISDIALEELQKILQKNGLNLKDITNIYLTKGPGSYTGVRVAVTIAKTLKTINNSFKVYLISSLFFQAGLDSAVSILDAKGGKVYIGIYDNGICIIQDQLIPLEILEDFIENFQKFVIKKDYLDLDYVSSYLKLKHLFEEATDVEQIEPLYIKSFI